MSRSKIQTHVSILQALIKNGRSNRTHLTYETYLNHSCVNKSLSFLRKHDLINEIRQNKRRTYEITQLGVKAVNLANEINNSLKVFGETPL